MLRRENSLVASGIIRARAKFLAVEPLGRLQGMRVESYFFAFVCFHSLILVCFIFFHGVNEKCARIRIRYE